MKNKIILVLLSIIILCASTVPVFAESSSDYQNKINQANKQIKELEGEIDKGLQAVEEINDQIETVQNEITILNVELTKLEKSIKEKEKELVEKRKLLEERMVAMYMAGDTTYLDVLLSGGFVDFVSNYYLVSQVVEYDTNLIGEVEKIKTTLVEEKSQVETKKQEKVNKEASLKTLKSQKQSKVDSLSKEQKDLQGKVDVWDSKMREIQEEERRRAAAAAAANGNLQYSGGQLQWPVPASSKISSPFGYRIHPIFNTYKLHTGIDIPASSGSNIVAAESGVVLLSSYGYNGGYGNYVIILHGDGLTTRYAHCSSLGVSEGQAVAKGQVIASVGSTGDSTGPHLHFEVRKNGICYDPLSYL